MTWGNMERRSYTYDFIRCVAIIMVLGVHCVPATTGTVMANLYNSFMYALLFTSNALFFIMSGHFNIKDKYILSNYYYKKIRNILLPTMVYMFIYTIWDRLSYGSRGYSVMFQFVLNAFSGFRSGVFWFVMSLFGMLLLAPIIASAFKSMNQEVYRTYVALTLIFLFLTLVGSVTGYPCGWSYPFGVGFALFCFGAAFDIDRAKEHYYLYFFLAILCTVIGTYLNYLAIANVNDNSPFYAIASVSIYVLLYKFGNKMKPNKLVSIIAKHSFGLYMCHIPVLQSIQCILPSLVRPAAHFVLLIIVLAITLPIVMLVDATFVRLLQLVADALHKSKDSRAVSNTSI